MRTATAFEWVSIRDNHRVNQEPPVFFTEVSVEELSTGSKFKQEMPAPIENYCQVQQGKLIP